jgi:hypothetical protein
MVTDAQEPVNRRTREFAKLVADVTREMANTPGYGEGWQPKLQDAADLVFSSAVDLSTDPATVRSGSHAYQIDATYGCTCLDARHRNRHCKHWLALEMEKRIQGGTEMPRKSTPQDEWEAKVATGPAVDDLFGDPKENPDEALEAIEPDDIPEPEVPEAMQQAVVETFGPNTTHRTEGHQYTDYPSTLCLKRHIGQTEISWTFRGTNDEEVWGRATRYIRTIDELAKRAMPPPQAAPAAPAPPAPPAQPPAASDGERAVNHGIVEGAPWCATHNRYYEQWTKGQRTWYAHKAPEGGFCNPPRS